MLAGFVESRLLGFIRILDVDHLPLKPPVQLYPVSNKTQRSANSICYFVGFNVDLEALRQRGEKTINVDDSFNKFK